MSLTLTIKILMVRVDQLKLKLFWLLLGRRAYTDGLQLDKIGLETDKFGRVEINDHFETKVAGVYAIGDVIKGPMLALKAEEKRIACAEHIVGEAGPLPTATSQSSPSLSLLFF